MLAKVLWKQDISVKQIQTNEILWFVHQIFFEQLSHATIFFWYSTKRSVIFSISLSLSGWQRLPSLLCTSNVWHVENALVLVESALALRRRDHYSHCLLLSDLLLKTFPLIEFLLFVIKYFCLYVRLKNFALFIDDICVLFITKKYFICCSFIN